MLKAALLENMRTRQDVFGSRQFAPLTGIRVPLPTNPPIVGDTRYKLKTSVERPGTRMYRSLLQGTRDFSDTPALELSEPNMFNISRK
jgi:hypothetical protein